MIEGLFCERCAWFTHWWFWLSAEPDDILVLEPFCQRCGGVVGKANEPGMRSDERYLLTRAITTENRTLAVGDVLGRMNEGSGPHGEAWPDGYCGGEFGRDSYYLKRVEVIGGDYVVCRNSCGRVETFSGDPSRLVEYILPPEMWDA